MDKSKLLIGILLYMMISPIISMQTNSEPKEIDNEMNVMNLMIAKYNQFGTTHNLVPPAQARLVNENGAFKKYCNKSDELYKKMESLVKCALCKIEIHRSQKKCHKRWHEGKSDFECDICLTAYSSNSGLNSHKKSAGHKEKAQNAGK